MNKLYIVWNNARNEGVIFTDKIDAKSATNGKPHRASGYLSISSLADAFHECYGDEKLKVETLELSAICGQED